MGNSTLSKKEVALDVTLKIGISLTITAVLFFVISFLYIPDLSYKMYNNYASFSGLSGVDSSLDINDLLITEKREFTQSKGEIIVFNLTGYDKSDGIKAYRVFSINDDIETGQKYCLVTSTGTGISFYWKVTESMYLGTVTTRIAGLGALTGDRKSVV